MKSITSMTLRTVVISFLAWGAWGCGEEKIDHDQTVMYPTDTQEDEDESDSDDQSSDASDSDDQNSDASDSDDQSSDASDSDDQNSDASDSDVQGTDEPIDFDCEDWSLAQADMEVLIGAAINERRQSGFACAGITYPPVEPLVAEGMLNCAARYHSLDMAINDFVSGDNGSDPMEDFGYTDWKKWGAVVSAGRDVVEEIVDSIMTKDSQCSKLAHKDFADFGVGVAFVEDSKYGWYTTVLLGNR